MDLNGKVAVITGAASGFGEAIAYRFAKLGAKVVIVDLNGEKAALVAHAIGECAVAVRADVTSRTDIDAAVRTAVETFGLPTSSSTTRVSPTRTGHCSKSMRQHSTGYSQ